MEFPLGVWGCSQKRTWWASTSELHWPQSKTLMVPDSVLRPICY